MMLRVVILAFCVLLVSCGATFPRYERQRPPSTCNCLDLVSWMTLSTIGQWGLVRGSQGMSFSWVYGKIDGEDQQKVGCSND